MRFASIPPPPFDHLQLGPFELRLYALLLTTAAVISVVWGRRRYLQRAKGDPDAVDRTAFGVAIAVLVGARGAYVIGNWSDYADDPLSALYPWRGGLAIYGGIATASLVGVWLARRNALSPAAGFDSAAAVLPLASAIGRLGNYFNQEVYGLPSELPWALRVEPEHRMVGFAQFETFHPTFLYEIVADLIVMAAVLWIERRKVFRPGSLFLIYLAGYGGFRFFIEFLRIDSTVRIFGLSRNAYASAGAVLIGTIGFFFWNRRTKGAA